MTKGRCIVAKAATLKHTLKETNARQSYHQESTIKLENMQDESTCCPIYETSIVSLGLTATSYLQSGH
jgi:hypothetical protein